MFAILFTAADCCQPITVQLTIKFTNSCCGWWRCTRSCTQAVAGMTPCCQR